MASPTKKEVEDLIRYDVNRAKREINSNKMLLKKKNYIPREGVINNQGFPGYTHLVFRS